MTATTARPTKATPFYLTSGLPQVNLLPPEVSAARGLVVAKRWLGLALLLVLVFAAAGSGGAAIVRQAAYAEQADAQDESVLLQAEQAQYAEVPIVLTDLTRAQHALSIGMSPEILWKGYLDAIAAVLPANVSMTSFNVVQASATVAGPVPPDLLASQGVASITFVSNAVTLPDNAAWLDALDSIPGFYAATFSSAKLGEESSVVSYDIASTVQIDLTAYSHRFTGEGS